MKYPIQLMHEMGLRVFVCDTENPMYCFFTDEITRETLLAAMQTFAPHWVSASDRASVRKYHSIDDYLKASKWNSELTEVTL